MVAITPKFVIVVGIICVVTILVVKFAGTKIPAISGIAGQL